MATDIERWRARDSLIYSANSKLGVCEKLRLIYDELYTINPKNLDEITELFIDAMIMIRKMSRRLQYYKTTYKDITGNDGANLPRSLGTVKRLKMRRERKNHDK